MAQPGPLELARIEPMRAPERSWDPFSSEDWLYEIKYDGWRMLAEFSKQAVVLRTKGGTDCTAWFPEVAQALAKVPGGPYIVDGEICVLDDQGRSDFDRLTARALRRKFDPSAPATYCIFDLLVEGQRNWMCEPLHARKHRLAEILMAVPKRAVLFVADLPAQAELWQAFVPQLELEGFVAKRRDSTYQPGVRSPDWRKLKRKGAIQPGRFRRRA